MIVNNEVLKLTIIDINYAETVFCRINGYARPLILWTRDAYVAAGDYTQQDIENRIIELLGNNPEQVLTSLK